MSHGAAHQHKTMRARGISGKNGSMGAGIQLTGTSFQYHLEGDYPVCKGKKGGREGGTDEEQEQKNEQVRGHKVKGPICFQSRQRNKRVGASKCYQEETFLMLTWTLLP